MFALTSDTITASTTQQEEKEAKNQNSARLEGRKVSIQAARERRRASSDKTQSPTTGRKAISINISADELSKSTPPLDRKPSFFLKRNFLNLTLRTKINPHNESRAFIAKETNSNSPTIYRHSLGESLPSSTNGKKSLEENEIGSHQFKYAQFFSNSVSRSERDGLELIGFHLENEILKEEESPALLCHFWYLPTDDFAHLLIEQALQFDQRKEDHEASRLLKMANALIGHPQFYPISSQALKSISEKCSNLSDKQTEQKRALILKILRFSQGSRSRAHSTSTETIEKVSVQGPLRKFSEIAKAIAQNAVTKDMINQLAFDLKKIETRLLSQVLPKEFAIYKSNTFHEEAAHISLYAQYSNFLTYFFAAHLLSYQSAQVRAICCKFYIRLIRQSLELGNYNTAFFLYCALNHTSIKRLSQTWKWVKKKDHDREERIKETFSASSNHKNYRLDLEQREKEHKKVNAQNCIIPILSFYLKNFTFINENITYKDNHLNTDKVSLLATQHASFQKYQRHLWTFKEDLILAKCTYDIYEQISGLTADYDREKIDARFDNLYQISIKLESSKSI